MDNTEKTEPADLIVKAKVKALIKEADMNTSAEVWSQLDATITHAVNEAIRRAKANNRKTVKGCDI